MIITATPYVTGRKKNTVSRIFCQRQNRVTAISWGHCVEMGLPTGRPFKKFVTRDGRESGYTTTLSVLPAVFLGTFFLSILFWNDFFKTIFGADNLAAFAFVFALVVTVFYSFVISPLLKKLEKEPKTVTKHDVAAKVQKVEERSVSRNRGKPRSYK